MSLQATGATTIEKMNSDAKLAFTSKTKAMVKSLTGVDVTDENNGGDDNGGNGGGNGSGNGGGSNSGGDNGNSGQSQQTSGYALTISKTGVGSASVTKNGNAVASGASLSEDDEVEISITPAEGQVPTATINGSEIELTESSGVYSGSFAMPGQASTLIINTGEGEDDDYDPNA